MQPLDMKCNINVWIIVDGAFVKYKGVLDLQCLSTIFITLSFVAKYSFILYKKHREKEILCKQGYNFCDSSANVLLW